MTKEIYKMYGGRVTLVFDPDKHIYTVDDKVIYGTTSICGVIAKPALMYWAVNMAVGYLGENLKPGVSLDEIQIKTLLEEARKQHTIKKDKSADIGTMTHEWIEKYLKAGVNKQPLPPLPINEEMKESVKSMLAWAKENKVKFIDSERKVLSLRYGYAGTCDAIAKIGGKLAVVDFKTSNAIYPEYFLQTAAYLVGLKEEMGKRFTGGIWVLRLSKGKDEKPFEAVQTTDIKNNFEAFLGAKRLYEWQMNNKKLSILNGVK